MRISVKAPAKLNLTLDVTGKRNDGYHLLDMLVQTVDLCDDLDISLNASGTVTLSEDSGTVPTDGDNLAVKAAELILKAAGSEFGCHINLKKHIPVAAGLGGGSSDAAAVLKGLNTLLGEPFSTEQLVAMSLPLGADVPMCVIGGTLRAKSIGEELSKIGRLPECVFVITKNGQKPSTGEMYKRLSSANIDRRPNTDRAVAAIAAGDLEGLCANIHNVFLYAVTDKTVAEDLDIIRKSGALAAGLSGSGPSVFGIFSDTRSVEKCAAQLKAVGKNAFVCKATE